MGIVNNSFSALTTGVLYAAYGNRASYYDDWLDAFKFADGFRVKTFNIARNRERRIFASLVKQFDLIVILHSVNADNMIYANRILPLLQARKGRLLSFIGNELNLPGAPMANKIAFLKDAGADVVATQLLQKTGEYLYEDSGATIAAIPHALNPSVFRPFVPLENRTIEIGVRSFRYLSAFMGDEDRNRLIDLFAQNKFKPPLLVDINTEQRLKRDEWATFLNNCKGTVANEAGGHWIEKTDATIIDIMSWYKCQGNRHRITINAHSPLKRFSHMLPWTARQWIKKAMSKGFIQHESVIGEDMKFDEVYKRFFKSKPFPPEFSGKCVTSRHFDAAGTQTCQLLIDGRYNDIFQADEHYIPIKSDLSDAADAVAKFRDITYKNQMVKRAYDYVVSEHTYLHRIRQIEALVRAL